MRRKHMLRWAVGIGVFLAAAMQAGFTAAANTADNGWYIGDNHRIYYAADGRNLTGEQMIDDTPYLFAPNGVLQTGWQTVFGKRYYYDRDGKAQFGWVEWRGETYYVTLEGGKQTTSFIDDAQEEYNFDACGVLLEPSAEAWTQNAEGLWRYGDAVGETEIDGIVYLFDENHRLMTGFQTLSDGTIRYYDGETHNSVIGWLTTDEKTYYLSSEQGLLKGRQSVVDTYYYFSAEDGSLQYGWITNEETCFADENGRLVTGAREIEGTLYHFREDGTLGSGAALWNDRVYVFSDSGLLQSGWVTDDAGNKYYGDENGAALTGRQSMDDSIYFFDAQGVMQKGWIETDGAYCYADPETGVLAVNFTRVDGIIYYFDAEGERGRGVTDIDGTIFLLNDKGIPQVGWYTAADGSKYYGSGNASAVIGWQVIGDVYYYFHEDGKMAVSETIENYVIGADGVARCQMAVTVDNLLKNTNGTPTGIFSYCTSRYRYSHIEATRTVNQLMNAGWDTLVQYTLSHRSGVCYYLAATYEYFCKRAGYTTRMIHATHSTGNHYWVQVLQDGVWHTYDPTYSARNDISWNYQISLGNYTVLGIVETEYDARGKYVGCTYTRW
ncbi:MAG: hypothetical protein MJ071_02925 [Oscillospiraceae bacterium]|nr:hypothetical protein [Oscillospiraceae bacterium]